MEALIAFGFGWMMGARSGPEGVEELSAALSSLRQSEEFGALIVAVRKHAAHVLRGVAERVESSDQLPLGVPDILAKVYELIYPEASAGA